MLFSPDGNILATGSADAVVRLWKVSDPDHAGRLGQPMAVQRDRIEDLAFSPDGRMLATASDNIVRLWDLTDPTKSIPPPQTLTSAGGVGSVAFSPDGQTLATHGFGEPTRLWDMNVDHAIDRICAVTRKTLTAEQWRRNIGNIIPYHPPCV